MPKHAQAIGGLLRDPTLLRLTGFIDSRRSAPSLVVIGLTVYVGAFRTFSKQQHKFYRDRMKELTLWDPKLLPIFPNSAFSAATFNFGPEVRTYRHKDFNNLSHGWCSITALGDFDPKAGGHLVLWELKKIIEFPAGSTIFIPSALVSHSNTPTSPSERRQSFTQYTAGSILRFMACGFQAKGSLRKGATMKRWWAPGQTLFEQLDSVIE